MPISSINGKKYNTALGPYTPNPLIILELKILLTAKASEEILSPFLFDSGACNNYLTMDTFMKLCKASNFSKKWEFKKGSAIIANGEQIEFDCLEKILFVKLEDNHVFDIPFIINSGIHRNIIGLRTIPEYMRWVIGSKEFYILRSA